jgi:hypothetical protein
MASSGEEVGSIRLVDLQDAAKTVHNAIAAMIG